MGARLGTQDAELDQSTSRAIASTLWLRAMSGVSFVFRMTAVAKRLAPA
jgi:hypothetical protein